MENSWLLSTSIIVIFVFILYLVWYWSSSNKKISGVRLFFLGVLLFVEIFFSSMMQYIETTQKLSKDVNLNEVSLKGENYFQASINIYFKDGRLKNVILIPNTTKKEMSK